MSPNEVGALMTAMLPQEEKLAQKKIEAKFKKSVETTNSGGIGDKESTITGDSVEWHVTISLILTVN